MNLHIVRYSFSPKSLIGKLDIDGVFFCNTLENAEKAIPEGTYEARIRYSHKNGRDVIGLYGIKDHSDIEIHPANEPEQLEGCIAVGDHTAPDWIGNSQQTFGKLIAAFREPAIIQIESIHLDSEKPDEAA